MGRSGEAREGRVRDRREGGDACAGNGDCEEVEAVETELRVWGGANGHQSTFHEEGIFKAFKGRRQSCQGDRSMRRCEGVGAYFLAYWVEDVQFYRDNDD